MDRKIWQAIQEIGRTTEELQARFSTGRRIVTLHVIPKGRNRWLLEAVIVDGESETERRTLHIQGRRYRKLMKRLAQADDKSSTLSS